MNDNYDIVPIFICPSCKYTGEPVPVVRNCGMSKTWYEVVCGICGHTGKRSATEFGAVLYWNHQAEKSMQESVRVWEALENADIWY